MELTLGPLVVFVGKLFEPNALVENNISEIAAPYKQRSWRGIIRRNVPPVNMVWRYAQLLGCEMWGSCSLDE